MRFMGETVSESIRSQSKFCTRKIKKNLKNIKIFLKVFIENP